MENQNRELLFLEQQKTQSAIEALSQSKLGGTEEFKLIKKLRQDFTFEGTSWLLNQVKLRQKALRKFPSTMVEKMYFEEKALEQATAWPLALHRAQKLQAIAPEGPILDLGCGMGCDALAIAHYRPVIAIDLEQSRLDILQANAKNLALPYHVQTLQLDYIKNKLPQASAAFSDPARRIDSKRIYKVEETFPPLKKVVGLARFLNIPTAIKLAPSFDKTLLEDLPGASLEFVGLNKQCREAVLWLNCFAEPSLQASIYLKDGTWHQESLPLGQDSTVAVGDLHEGQYLYEIEPVLLRAGLLHKYADKLQAHLFDEQTSWLISDNLVEEPLADAFLISEIHKFSLKTLQKRIKDLNIGILEIKKRNSAIEPEIIRQKIRTCPTKNELTVFVTRQNGQPLFMLGQRISNS